MPPHNNPRTKKVKQCRECGKSMDGEHPAAKSCAACRGVAEVKPEVVVAKMEPVMGDVVGPDPEEAKRQQAVVVPPPCEVEPLLPPPPSVSVTPFFLKGGDEVSINLKQRKFIILPRSRWELNPRQWSGIIPEVIDPVELKMLRVCLEAGDLLKGKVYTGIKKDETTLRKAAMLLELDEQSMRNSLGLIVQNRGLIGGYLNREIFRYLIRFEDDNDHRRPVLDLLQNAIEHVGKGPLRTTPVISRSIEEVVDRQF